MLVIKVEELIKTLQQYQPDETLMVTWWSAEDVEMLMPDNEIETGKANEIWENIVDDLDNNTSDHVISYVNDELDTMVYAELENS